ncbi:uncharacterized protein LOC124943221 [Impatiens glandulifera]|uniref:uncharacterized protein LOC124943221 n=1 Tax=Impatiens glandulifera TaxID=253017 RepID=UPI001FB10137|nr:uncharacterized protein LOC124943221 [Impatiens glandulifera]
MDPSQNYNFFPNYFPNQAQNPNIQPSNQNIERPEDPMNTGIHPNIPQQYMMPPNFGMQYPYNHHYMPYGYPPISGNNFHVAHTNYPNSEQPNNLNTQRFCSGSTDIPEFSTQISPGDVDWNTQTTFLAPTQQSIRKSYDPLSTEDNKALLNGYFHFSNDSELGRNQKGDTFWGKIAEFVNDKFEGEKPRTVLQCKSHFRSINKKIASFIGYYSSACRTKCSGWSDDNYVEKALELYRDNEKQRFSLLKEWKMVRDQPRYMVGENESGSSGSKRKSGGDEVESSAPSIIRPEGRDATKKKARKTSTSRKSKAEINEELSNVASTLEKFEERRASTTSAMLEYARVRKLEMLMSLKNKEERDVVDENTYQMLLRELFPN